jgi:hypothetical protein
MKKVSKPIIIIGSGRSGTTIISEIIFRHEDLAWPSTYQEKFPAFSSINLVRNIFDNPFWRRLGQKRQLNKVSRFNKILFKPSEAYNFWEHITGKRIDFSRGFLLEERASEEEKKKIRSVFSKMVAYQKRKRLAFKITGPSRIGYLTSIFPDALFINIVREPLPTIHSWLKVDFWQNKGKNQLWWTGAYNEEEINWASNNSENPPLLAALQYKKLNDITKLEIEKHKVKCLTVRYEDFVLTPEKIIEDILDFCGLPESKLVTEYMKRNKIYNQNKKEVSTFSKQEDADIEKILAGIYSF